MVKKYLKVMDAYVIVNEFFSDVVDRVTNLVSSNEPE